MKKVFDLRKVIPHLNENAPHIFMDVALELMITNNSVLMDYQGKTDEEVGIMVGNGYSEATDDSMDYAFVDETDFVPLTVEELDTLVFQTMENAILQAKIDRADNFLRTELGLD